MSTISFPGLGINEFSFSKTAFSIFGLDVAWYGIILTSGIIAAFIYVYFIAKKAGLILDDLIDVAFFTVIPAIVCARIYYVLFYELENPGSYIIKGDFWGSVYKCIAIWNGGIAIYGSIIGGAIGAYLALKYKKIRFAQFFDILGPSVMLGQIIGRWGNFANSEAYGRETTLPWRMGVIENGERIFVHPTFLYESLWNLIGFVIINVFAKKRKFEGEVVLFYISWYGLGRAFVEGLRTDSLYIGSSGIRVSQLVGILCFVFGMGAIILIRILLKNPEKHDIIYLGSAKSYKAAYKIVYNTDLPAAENMNTEEETDTEPEEADTEEKDTEQEDEKKEEDENNADNT